LSQNYTIYGNILYRLMNICSSCRSYLILGKEKEGDHPGLTVSRRSIVIEWKDEWHRRMRRFQHRSRKCK